METVCFLASVIQAAALKKRLKKPEAPAQKAGVSGFLLENG